MIDNAVTLFYSPHSTMIWLYQGRKGETSPGFSVPATNPETEFWVTDLIVLIQTNRVWKNWPQNLETGNKDQHWSTSVLKNGAYFVTWETLVLGSYNNSTTEFLCSTLCSAHSCAPAESHKNNCRNAYHSCTCVGTRVCNPKRQEGGPWKLRYHSNLVTF